MICESYSPGRLTCEASLGMHRITRPQDAEEDLGQTDPRPIRQIRPAFGFLFSSLSKYIWSNIEL